MSEPDNKTEKVESGTVPSQQDVALVHGTTPDGGYRILRRRGENLELGSVHPLVEGKPLSGEVVALTPRKGCPLVCDVQTLYSAPSLPQSDTAAPKVSARPPMKKGPAQVSNDTYRENWDVIWSRPKKNEAVN